jgi:hypothetical protein
MTFPFYWGCPNIEEFFPTNSFVKLDIDNVEKSIEIVKKSIETPITTEKIQALEEAKRLTLDKYNLFPTLNTIVADINRK